MYVYLTILNASHCIRKVRYLAFVSKISVPAEGPGLEPQRIQYFQTLILGHIP